MKARILIVGGGAMGTCIAQHAARKCDPLTEPVVLIEKNQLGAGSSGRSAAIIHQQYSDRVLAGMARDAQKVYATFEQSTGRTIGYKPTGVLILSSPTKPEMCEQLRRDAEMQASIGIGVRLVDADEIRNLVPGIECSDGTIGAFQPGGGYLDPVRAIEAFATLARNQGAVTRIGVSEPRLLVENDRVIGVKTSAGNFYAPQVVLATGPWTPEILREFGVELPLRVVRTQQHFLEMPEVSDFGEDDDVFGHDAAGVAVADAETRFFSVDPLDKIPSPHPVLFDLARDFWARPEPSAGRTRLGRLSFRGLEDVVDPETEARLSDEFKLWARSVVSERLATYRDRADRGSHASWFTLTPDERPIIGPVSELPGLYVATGFHGNDFQLAPSIGEGLSQMMFEEPVSAFDPGFFSLDRFEQASGV